jgi:hypothetical protein
MSFNLILEIPPAGGYPTAMRTKSGAVRYSSLTLLLLLCPASLPGQTSALHFGIDPMSFFESRADISARGTPVGMAHYTHRFEADFDSLPGDISSHETNLLTPLLPLSYDRFRFLAAASYRVNWFDTSSPILLPDDTLHSVRLPVGVIYEVSDRWLASGFAMPGYSGDGSDFSDGFSILSTILFGYKHSERLRFFAGGVYFHGFDEDNLFPGLGLLWDATDDLSVMLLPPWAALNYRFGEDWLFSLFGRYEKPTWNVEADSAGPSRDISMRELRAGLRVERRIANRFWLSLAGGVSFARQMEVETTSGTSLQKSDIDPGAFIQTGFTFRY